ncbi:MAG TPA: TIR domain-containing protein, partial [Methanocella sp.]
MRLIALVAALLVLACFAMTSACAQASDNESTTPAGFQRLIDGNFDNGSIGWNIYGYDVVNENHNTFLSGGWSDDNKIQLNRPFMATDFTLKARFRINDAGKNIRFGYRYYASMGQNGYFLNLIKTGQEEYIASLEKNFEGATYQLDSRSIYLDEVANGGWHQVVIDGRGASISVSVDDRTVCSVTDGQNPIQGGSILLTSDDHSSSDIDDVEIWAVPEDTYMPANVTNPDWSLAGITLLKLTNAADATYLFIDFFPAARISFDRNVFGYTLFGLELGNWGLAFTILADIVVIFAVLIGISELLWRLIKRVFKRMNRSVNRTVIKGKARIYRARAKSDREGEVAAAGAGPAKTISNDVFISYSGEDRKVADLICANLESKKIKCWMAPRDVPAGDNYQAAIIDAIDASSMMVLVFSANSNNSPHVIREITRAVSHGILL